MFIRDTGIYRYRFSDDEIHVIIRSNRSVVSVPIHPNQLKCFHPRFFAMSPSNNIECRDQSDWPHLSTKEFIAVIVASRIHISLRFENRYIHIIVTNPDEDS
jgi:hypothetical protein